MSWYRRLLRSNSGAGVLHSKHCHACHERCYIQALNTLRKECIKLQVKYSEYLCGRLNANKFRNLQSLDESRLNYSRHRSQNARTSFLFYVKVYVKKVWKEETLNPWQLQECCYMRCYSVREFLLQKGDLIRCCPYRLDRKCSSKINTNDQFREMFTSDGWNLTWH